ncbi:glycosyltransferase family 2 protein [Lentisphaera marina]|uniref:glycosyltransferase family 2 protein n=1 Tax=Lentisphaera marina TaxID=1111041 RepID=UPI0023666D56|nr:glycosyltransferase family 2 protein [Lentisphaera marina]MDD7987228.1 glycosyltransferase family 2 protein [Lentisphaera marina]
MNILIGMLIHNEEDIVAKTLHTLFKQNIFESKLYRIELIIVANACSDNSAAICRNELKNFSLNTEQFTYQVIEKDEPGKIPAWNDLIHQYSSNNEKYIIMMDGDILIQQDNNFETLIQSLENDQHALISTDLPIKDIHYDQSNHFLKKFSLGFSKITRKGEGQLCGQLYCARSSFLRQVIIPKEILIDDTYIKFMACTDGLLKAVDNSRIINHHSVTHVFEAYTGAKNYFNNQVRQTVGFSMWRIFKTIIKNENSNKSALEIIREKFEVNPQWLQTKINAYLDERNWYIYEGALSVRFKRLKRLKTLGKIKMFIPSVAAWLIDLPVILISNSKIKNARLEKLWQDTKSTKMAHQADSLVQLKTKINRQRV